MTVHGAGQWSSDVCRRQSAALAQILGWEPPCLPCWYTDISNFGPPVSAAEYELQAQSFREELKQEIRTQRRKHEAQDRKKHHSAGSRAILVADVILDVTRYLFDAHLRDSVEQRLEVVLEHAACDYQRRW